MFNLSLCLVVQLYLVFGVAGLIWPEKLMPVFGVLMFPWTANHRVIRANGIMAMVAYALVLVKLFLKGL